MSQTINDLLEAARARLERLDPITAREAAASGALIVDTRCAEARHASGVIPGSVHVPLSVLYWRLDRSSGHADERLADRDTHFILVCADGYSSSLAAATLRDLGFSRATDLAGGFNGWAAAGMPVEAVTQLPRQAGRSARRPSGGPCP